MCVCVCVNVCVCVCVCVSMYMWPWKWEREINKYTDIERVRERKRERDKERGRIDRKSDELVRQKQSCHLSEYCSVIMVLKSVANEQRMDIPPTETALDDLIKCSETSGFHKKKADSSFIYFLKVSRLTI